MANNRVCLTCGKAYEYCGYCPTSKNLPMWMNLFDTENCKNVFETVSDYAQGAISKETAVTDLSLCDLSKVSTYKENIQKLVSEIIDNKNDKKVYAYYNQLMYEYDNQTEMIESLTYSKYVHDKTDDYEADREYIEEAIKLLQEKISICLLW